LGAGAVLWATGRVQQRLVDTRRELLTLQYQGPEQQYDDIARSARYATMLPWITTLLTDLQHQRAASRYWQHEYASVAVARDATGAAVEHDPELLLVSANARFRRERLDGADKAGDRVTVQRLNEILEQYAEALRRDPQFDAAYNYEFVARTR